MIDKINKFLSGDKSSSKKNNKKGSMNKEDKNVITLLEATSDDVNLVGGKNASLGEMITELTPKGINVPGGFAVTSTGYWKYIEENRFKDLNDKFYKELI